MKIIMMETINGKGFSFEKGKKYKALDGDETEVKNLSGKILVRRPDSPKKDDRWAEFDKSYVDKKFIIL